MKGTNIGEFEELVLLTVGMLYQNAYSLSIVEELRSQTGRKVTLSTVHKALVRLESKGYLISKMGGATEERGGRNKKLYEMTQEGKKAVIKSKELRDQMWEGDPNIVWQSNDS